MCWGCYNGGAPGKCFPAETERATMSAIVRRPPCAETGSLRLVPPARPVSGPQRGPVHPVAPPGPTPGIAPPPAREASEGADRNASAHLAAAGHYPAEVGFTGGGMHVRVEFGISNGLAGMTVFVAPADEDAAPGMGVLSFASPPEQARVIGRALLALADAAEQDGDAP